VALALGALLLPSASCQARRSSRRPPIILISIDTLRADRLGCYGYRSRRVSPFLDALARESIVFEQHIAAAPWTTPSHLSLLTSRRPSAHGVTESFRQLNAGLTGPARLPVLPEDVPTLAQVLKRAGWATGALTGGVTMDPRIGFGRGFDVYDTSMFKLRAGNVRRLLQWVTAQGQRPFFLFWHSFEVHAPYLRGDFLPEALPPERARALSRALARLERHPERSSTIVGRRVLERHDAFNAEVTSALYDGGVLAMDRWIGRVIEHLRSRSLYDRSLIVVTSDHGEQLGGRGRGFYDLHGRTLYDEMIRVPLIIKLPGQARAGTRVGVTTRAIDVMPTILDLAGVSGKGLGLQGKSLQPLWENPERASPRLALTESTSGPDELKSLRSDDCKYIMRIDRQHVRAEGRSSIPTDPAMRQLFALADDPHERSNLLGLPNPPASAEETAARFDEELRARVGEAPGTVLTRAGDSKTLDDLRALGYLE
jgi:arylsulfatase A-like enzyme